MASDTTPQHEAETGQGGSLFFSLPAELRNDIYELALSADSKEPIELLSASPPSNAMVTTCRQAYNEAASIYRAARLRYYSTNQFVIVVVCSTVKVGPLVSCDNAFIGEALDRIVFRTLAHAEGSEWDQIRDITVTFQWCYYRMIYRLLPELGVWKQTMVRPPMAAMPPQHMGYFRVSRSSGGKLFSEIVQHEHDIGALPPNRFTVSMKKQLEAFVRWRRDEKSASLARLRSTAKVRVWLMRKEWRQ
ncbi:hypothetical protein LTR22_010233 [Elasticomyces elasticus]|nr:hypothetical protein LTR22_010233 [Elasticomyces elasticus]KAK4922082.1 hypothetical protein LTR49_010493 [Elasticomyces elasticus]